MIGIVFANNRCAGYSSNMTVMVVGDGENEGDESSDGSDGEG